MHQPLAKNKWGLAEAQQRIRNDTRENVIFYKNGRQLLRFRGETNYVNPPEECLLRMRDCVVVHNHPKSISFSLQDIKAIIQHDAYRLIVVSPLHEYRLTRPAAGWPIDFNLESTYEFLEECISLSQDSLRKQETTGEIFSSEKQLLENHYIWSLFFNRFEIQYEKY